MEREGHPRRKPGRRDRRHGKCTSHPVGLRGSMPQSLVEWRIRARRAQANKRGNLGPPLRRWEFLRGIHGLACGGSRGPKSVRRELDRGRCVRPRFFSGAAILRKCTPINVFRTGFGIRPWDSL
jgi:hypothetical protein